jgi:hypothetical protein
VNWNDGAYEFVEEGVFIGSVSRSALLAILEIWLRIDVLTSSRPLSFIVVDLSLKFHW